MNIRWTAISSSPAVISTLISMSRFEHMNFKLHKTLRFLQIIEIFTIFEPPSHWFTKYNEFLLPQMSFYRWTYETSWMLTALHKEVYNEKIFQKFISFNFVIIIIMLHSQRYHRMSFVFGIPLTICMYVWTYVQLHIFRLLWISSQISMWTLKTLNLKLLQLMLMSYCFEMYSWQFAKFIVHRL